MGGTQSGAHSLGDVNLPRDTLWVQERQRQRQRERHHREGGRYENFGGQTPSDPDRRKLLKRTRSLAVVSEDDRRDRGTRYLRLGEPFDARRRQQLIPRAKLIDRNFSKDRLSKSQQHLSNGSSDGLNSNSGYDPWACDRRSVPPSLPDPAPRTRGSRADPDRLNILDWPEPPRRYRSAQNLDGVGGLVEVVEDDWPGEENRSVDCIYTQARRKRKEHRSLDSILREDEDTELEYFDVLNLLPLSNVRLEFDEFGASTNGRENTSRERETNFDVSETNTSVFSSGEGDCETLSLRRNVTDEEKRKSYPGVVVEALNEPKITREKDSRRASSSSPGDKESTLALGDGFSKQGSCSEKIRRLKERRNLESTKRHFLVLDDEEDRKYRADVAVVTPTEEDSRVEEAEDYKSIWISDTEEHEDMSRRPQVLRIVDSEVTRRNGSPAAAEMDVVNDKLPKIRVNDTIDSNDSGSGVETAERKASAGSDGEASGERLEGDEVRRYTEKTRNEEEDASKNRTNEGKFGRIIKETSSIIGKACSAVKGSLGFEARSESSDLGLGSESESDTRRRSVDDEDATRNESDSPTTNGDGGKSRGNLHRSRSCVDSIDGQESQEFDHIRYKIIKSDMFSKNMFGITKRDVAFDGLVQYLREYSFQELLVDNNVVIIEPVRAEQVERKSSPVSLRGKSNNPPTCKIAGAIQKKSEAEKSRDVDQQRNDASKESPLRRHFFYHPVRVNRELIDEELPDPDTVRNVRKMFENTLKLKSPEDAEFSRYDKTRKSVSMRDLSRFDEQFDGGAEAREKRDDGSRCSSSRAKDLTRLFENMDKASNASGKDEPGSPRSESKTRILAQCFEARSGHSSPSESAMSKHKVMRYLHNWDAGSVSSGVSSDYPDTDPGSGAHCTSSEEEEDDYRDDDAMDDGSGQYVSQDVLKKIRECGTSVTYYGGKVVDTCNAPLISPMSGKLIGRVLRNDPEAPGSRSEDYVKFRLVKSNSCDSRLELTGKFVGDSKNKISHDATAKSASENKSDLRQCPIMEKPSIETAMTNGRTKRHEEDEEEDEEDARKVQVAREPPIVIGLEPKKEENRDPEIFRADFKLGKLEDTRSFANKFESGTALNRWQMNETPGEKGSFGKMEFEEFEVLEDSLNPSVDQS